MEKEFEKMKELLKDLKEKRITKEEFDKKCAFWTVNILDSFKYQKVPQKPLILQEYEGLDNSEKVRINWGSFLAENPEVDRFYEKQAQIFWNTTAQLEWLVWCLQFVEDEDKIKIKNKIKEILEAEKKDENRLKKFDFLRGKYKNII